MEGPEGVRGHALDAHGLRHLEIASALQGTQAGEDDPPLKLGIGDLLDDLSHELAADG
jgi:hypothetical protein